ncbi:hypothetical protein [Paraburkholderia graminis]
MADVSYAGKVIPVEGPAPVRVRAVPQTNCVGTYCKSRKVEHEIATLEASHSEAEETYSVEHLELAVSLAFIVKLLSNDAISTWVYEHYDHLWGQVEAVASETAQKK